MTKRHAPGSNAELGAVLGRRPVVPILVIEDAAQAVPIARALIRGGLDVLEITLRTPSAWDAARAIHDEVEGATVGVGTVLSVDQYKKAIKERFAFAVSPGVTSALLEQAEDSEMPLLPGAATASESMRLLDHGFAYQKFFPAEPSGGLAFLKALASPLSDAVFCPTGGIGEANAMSYLSLPNVICVGGSWIVPQDAVESQDWRRITELAARASALGGHA